jgi:hypothetical protein
MKKFVFTIFIFVRFFLCQIHGQESADSIFNIEVRESEYGGTDVRYSDKNWDKYKSSPVFTSTKQSALDFMSFSFNSISKKDSIEQVLFEKEELDTLKRGFATCQIHIPSGRIVSVSFLIPITNKIESERIIRYKNEIEKNLCFDITLYSELKKEGYLRHSFPIFVSRRKRKR